MKLVYLTLSLLSALLIYSCAGAKKVETTEVVKGNSASPAESDVERMKTSFPDLTLDQLNQGKKIYEANCNKCHDLIKPENESVGKWYHEVPEMVKMRNEQEANSVNAEQEQLILKYVVTFAKR